MKEKEKEKEVWNEEVYMKWNIGDCCKLYIGDALIADPACAFSLSFTCSYLSCFHVNSAFKTCDQKQAARN